MRRQCRRFGPPLPPQIVTAATGVSTATGTLTGTPRFHVVPPEPGTVTKPFTALMFAWLWGKDLSDGVVASTGRRTSSGNVLCASRRLAHYARSVASTNVRVSISRILAQGRDRARQPAENRSCQRVPESDADRPPLEIL